MPTDSIPRHILVVDDQHGIRQLIRRVLAQEGYTVTDMNDGAKAIDWCQAHHRSGAELELAIIDLTMPIMDGITLTREIRALRPQLPIVLMSGFDMDDVLDNHHAIEPPPIFLEKPFKRAQLLATIAMARQQHLN